MDVDKDFVDMFLAGMSWERRKDTKPALKDAIREAFCQTRAAEQKRAPVQTEQTGSYTVCTICGKKNGEHDQSIHVTYERSLSKRSVGG